MLHRKCLNKNVAIFEVPADGNCMVWTLRSLFLSKNASDFHTKTAKREVAKIRSALADAWLQVKDRPMWQKLFKAFCAAQYEETAQAPVTPPKKPKTKPPQPDHLGLDTPPRPQPAASTRVAGAAPVPICDKANKSCSELMLPGEDRAKSFADPGVPDVQELYHQAMMNPLDDTNGIDINEANVDEIDQEMLDQHAATPEQERKRKFAHRSCKSKLRSQKEKQYAAFCDWLASQKDLGYYEWLEEHRSIAPVRKAWVCTSQGFPNMKRLLLTNRMPECRACQSILAKKGITLDLVREFAQQPPDSQPPASQPEAQSIPLQDQDQPEMSERDKILSFLRSQGPTIVPVHGGPVLRYRCTICTSKPQPHGKVNRLPIERLKSVIHFVDQHKRSRGHLQAEKSRAEANAAVPPSPDTDCPGFCIQDHADSNLYAYMFEFKLWMSHAKMDCLQTQHSYSHDVSTDRWSIRHHTCEKKFVPVPCGKGKMTKCCSNCVSLTDPKSVQKSIVKFASKFYPARLLQRRLFFTSEEVEQMLTDMKDAHYVRNNGQLWKRFVDMDNANLQAFVRRSFQTMPSKEMTPAMKSFYGSIVEPCLSVNVGSAQSNVVSLASQFAVALESNSQCAPCLGMPGIVWVCLGEVAGSVAICYQLIPYDTI